MQIKTYEPQALKCSMWFKTYMLPEAKICFCKHLDFKLPLIYHDVARGPKKYDVI